MHLFNLSMKQSTFALAFLLLLAPLVSHAQSQRELFRPPPERRSDRVNIGYRGMFGADVEFKNVGIVAPPVIEDKTGDTIVGRTYDDGFIGMDNTYSQANGYTSDGKTANFSYAYSDQYNPSDNTLNYNTYASTGASRGFTESGGTATGWELHYTRFFGKKQRLGWIFGFSFNSFDVDNASNTTADLLVKTDSYALGNTALPPAPYTGNLVRETSDQTTKIVSPRPLIPLPLDPASQGEKLMPGEAVVIGQYELRSAFFTFRTGPLYQFQFGKKFSIEVGAGVAGMFFSGEYSVTETVYPKWRVDTTTGAPTVVESPVGKRNIFKATERDGEWLVGLYADVTANYQWTDRVNVFGGVEYQALGNFTGTDGVSARTVEVDMGGNAYARAGLGIKF